MLRFRMVSLASLLLAVPVWAQQATPTASCEVQVQDQYRELSVAGIVPQATAPQWGPQLKAMTNQLSVNSIRYDIKKNQAELAEQQLAQMAIQLREANAQIGQLRTELDQHKPQAAATPPPAQ